MKIPSISSSSFSLILFLLFLIVPLLQAQQQAPPTNSPPPSSEQKYSPPPSPLLLARKYAPPPPPTPSPILTPPSPPPHSPLSPPPSTPSPPSFPAQKYPPPPPYPSSSRKDTPPPPPPPPFPARKYAPPPPPSSPPSNPSPPSPFSPPPPSSPEACKSTLYPKLCRSILKSIRSSPSDPYHLGKFSIKQSLKQAKKLTKAFNDFLQKHKSSSYLNQAEISALDDCGDLNKLNVDYLQTVSDILKSATSSNDKDNDELVEDTETYLSAVATNHYTCYDGLVAAKSNIANALAAPLNNVKQLYSVALGLVTEALNKNMKKHKTRKHGLPSNSYKVRQPLQKLIKFLQKTNSGCKDSSLNCTRKSERILEESNNGNGILLNSYVIVSVDGTENFTSIGDAIAIAPNNSKPEDGYFLIYVTQGIYEEYVAIPKQKTNILLVGDGINNTIITGNHSVIDGWTTFNSSTFAVSGTRFMAVDITFRNTAGPEKHQAVAVRSNADLSTFYRCSFEGYQDTLYVHSLRQFYRECDIYGTVDFIFGNAAVVFQSCNIYARKPMASQNNAVTAQGRTDPNQNTGISIQNCTIQAAPDLEADLESTQNYLGRPWKEYSRTVYMQSYIGDLVNPSGWLEWNGTVGLATLFYGEFKNYGPGAGTSNRVKWKGYNLLNATQAWNFTVLNFTLGDTWLPDTDIPYTAGLDD
ncbi:putative pectinesterase/pectinesterase inhibitor 47 [Stylosanthes scabra]|uniref:Pectinesterase n=1 Tax=Stylosanthes scabra TaxID=79078 RepID=A0ABU6SWR2_9FABA|nr:putative pectinesterase/pectinesterase inhibitor 47 [Stylosanthes scabra]